MLLNGQLSPSSTPKCRIIFGESAIDQSDCLSKTRLSAVGEFVPLPNGIFALAIPALKFGGAIRCRAAKDDDKRHP